MWTLFHKISRNILNSNSSQDCYNVRYLERYQSRCVGPIGSPIVNLSFVKVGCKSMNFFNIWWNQWKTLKLILKTVSNQSQRPKTRFESPKTQFPEISKSRNSEYPNLPKTKGQTLSPLGHFGLVTQSFFLVKNPF